MIKKGLLDKHGKPNETTPKDWKDTYEYYRYSQEDKRRNF